MWLLCVCFTIEIILIILLVLLQRFNSKEINRINNKIIKAQDIYIKSLEDIIKVQEKINSLIKEQVS